MAQAQKAQKQTPDEYAQRGKTLASSARRLRGWVGSDPSRTAELADVLVELTAHRLLGHGYAAAAADAQEAVRLAAQLLTANGPIGPYTTATDATRYLTAVVQLATIQVGAGVPDAAGRTIDSLQDMRQQLSELQLDEQLEPQTAIWALSATARAALAAGDAAQANAYADAALARLAESGLREDPQTIYLAMDVERLASDCRWAAGWTDEALTHLHVAKDSYEKLVAGRLREPARYSPALVERLAEPLFGLYRDLADRLTATGEVDLGLVTRRTLVELLQGLAGRLGDPARVRLAAALADLAHDLLAADRIEEAASTAAEADAIQLDRTTVARGVVSRSTQPLRWTPLTPAASYAAGPTVSDAPDANNAAQPEAVGWLEAERAEAHRMELERLEHARIGAEHREAERREAERVAAEQQATKRARAEQAVQLEAERRAAAEERERLETKRRREERLEAHRLEVELREAQAREEARLEAERRAAERLADDPAEAERQELERLQAELAALEQPVEAAVTETVESDEQAAERDAAERESAERLEAERLEAERAEAERAEAQRAEAERVEAERAEAERIVAEQAEAEREEAAQPASQDAEEPDELTSAQQLLRDLQAQGDRRGARAANERVVELLRSRAEADLATYGPQLRSALEELSSARLRSGDIWGSRAPAKEAKALAKNLGQ